MQVSTGGVHVSTGDMQVSTGGVHVFEHSSQAFGVAAPSSTRDHEGLARDPRPSRGMGAR
jgi:hypothetical protein